MSPGARGRRPQPPPSLCADRGVSAAGFKESTHTRAAKAG
jgi:hypothetical protein